MSFHWATEYEAAPTVQKVTVLVAPLQLSLKYRSASQTSVRFAAQGTDLNFVHIKGAYFLS